MNITKPFDFSMMTGKCHYCGKPLPKSLAYWCDHVCFAQAQDRLYEQVFRYSIRSNNIKAKKRKVKSKKPKTKRNKKKWMDNFTVKRKRKWKPRPKPTWWVARVPQ